MQPTIEQLTPEERRVRLAERLDLARRALMPCVRREWPEARTARAAFFMLGDAAAELAEEADDA